MQNLFVVWVIIKLQEFNLKWDWITCSMVQYSRLFSRVSPSMSGHNAPWMVLIEEWRLSSLERKWGWEWQCQPTAHVTTDAPEMQRNCHCTVQRCLEDIGGRNGWDGTVFVLLKTNRMFHDASDVVGKAVGQVNAVAPLTFRTSFLSVWEEKKAIRSGTIPQTHTWSQL